MLNKVLIQGRMSRDPELKYTQSGIPVASFSIVQNIGTGEDKKGHFFDCEAWRKTAEIITNHFPKGKEIVVEGELRQETWTTQEGQKRSKLKVLVFNVHFTGTKVEGGGSGEQQVTANTTSGFSNAPTYDSLDLDDDMDGVPF